MKILWVPPFLLFCLVVPVVRFVAWLALPKRHDPCSTKNQRPSEISHPSLQARRVTP